MHQKYCEEYRAKIFIFIISRYRIKNNFFLPLDCIVKSVLEIYTIF